LSHWKARLWLEFNLALVENFAVEKQKQKKGCVSHVHLAKLRSSIVALAFQLLHWLEGLGM
jgi:hypothetical protein